MTVPQKKFVISSSTADGAEVCIPAETVLVLQGGGALGAYQAGVYQALHEAGVEPDWVIGTSIGAINGAIITGNPAETRLKHLDAFWENIEQSNFSSYAQWLPGFSNFLSNMTTYTRGVPGFFEPNPKSILGPYAHMGPKDAAYYKTEPLRHTLKALVDFDYMNAKDTPRLTLGTVEVASGKFQYFDTLHTPLNESHIMASGALPPGFPAIQIGETFYWDGGICSNTPLEAVFNEPLRRNSLIFSVDLWDPEGEIPETLWEVMGRQKDIQYASRARNHLEHQKELQKLRQIILTLAENLPEKLKNSSAIRKLTAYGCSRTMHVVRLVAPHLDGEDYTKDIDFSAKGIRARRKAGYEDTLLALKHAPWQNKVEHLDAVLVHEISQMRHLNNQPEEKPSQEHTPHYTSGIPTI